MRGGVALAALLAAVLGGCAPLPPPAAPPQPDVDLCGAAGFGGLVGQRASALSALMLPAGTRIIRAGDPVTADYRAERLNIELDAQERVARVACY